ncbi:MAG: histidinol dehydrogenase, partial [Defluviitaleaceae bacterium]|nr:histidinol dehydrogenase [Defluviitaleaceae bacterium]
QAIAALAYGTRTVPKVDVIAGPGNAYVIAAKKEVYGTVGIDSLPGPSEIAVIADFLADPAHVAADLLSQAEHGERSAIVLLTDSAKLAESARRELLTQSLALERNNIAEISLKNNAMIIVTKNLEDAVELSNALAPEHLAIETREPLSILTRIKHAGAVFLGANTPEPLGDYMAGPSHVLPTETSARFFSPVSVDTFVKKTSVLYFDRAAMERLAGDVTAFAREEGLGAHANAINVRLRINGG